MIAAVRLTTLVAAASTKSHSNQSTLAIVFLTLGGFLIGGAISFGMRKRWVGTVVTGVLALVFIAVAVSYYRAAKGA